MNRIEVAQFLRSFITGLKTPQKPPDRTTLKPFLDLILSLKRNLPISIPLLSDLAVITSGGNAAGTLGKRIERRYLRLCRVQEELGRLNFKKAGSGSPKGFAGKASGFVLEDFVFSQIDFSRYRKIEVKNFEDLFADATTDFDEAFFKKNFSRGRTAIQSLIEESYKKTDGVYKLQYDNPLILSVMRTLETSLESSPLFTAEEISAELKSLFTFMEGGAGKADIPPGTELAKRLYTHLVLALDNVTIIHGDGMTTKLFIPERGDLSGTFRPGDKPWTLVLIPAELLRFR